MSIQKYEGIPLSDADIRQLLPGINIVSYPSLATVSSLDDICDERGRIVIFFETTSTHAGHWTCLWKQANGRWYYFDSHGLAPDQDLYFVPPPELKALKESRPLLSSLMGSDSNNYNNVQLQAFEKNVDTCGRHVVVRLWNKALCTQCYANRVGPDPDATVTEMTVNIVYR